MYFYLKQENYVQHSSMYTGGGIDAVRRYALCSVARFKHNNILANSIVKWHFSCNTRLQSRTVPVENPLLH